jgi:DNA-binding response OmpR family regulator
MSLRRILILEDDYFIADELARAVQELGLEVVGPIGDPDEALEVLSASDVDGAVLDINLGGKMGYPVADALHSRAIPFLFATGYGDASLPKRYEHVARWEKPFDGSALAIAVLNLVRESLPPQFEASA